MNNLNMQFIRQMTPELSLHQINDIPLIKLQHQVGTALISLQGAQLLQWQPHLATQDVLWLSEIEPFQLGTAIRGGVPICYPWFNNAGTPAHGWARINLWQLTDYEITTDKVRLDFAIFHHHLVQAKMQMTFTDQCRLEFTHFSEQPAQLALHSYFNIGDIQQIQISGLPTSCFDSLTQTHINVPSPRQIAQNVDCIYAIDQRKSAVNFIEDFAYQRKIKIEHQNSSDVVLWNPWHKPTSNMTENGYQTMICVETCRINQKMQQGEKVIVEISIN